MLVEIQENDGDPFLRLSQVDLPIVAYTFCRAAMWDVCTKLTATKELSSREFLPNC